jgi:hypothetical protein
MSWARQADRAANCVLLGRAGVAAWSGRRDGRRVAAVNRGAVFEDMANGRLVADGDWPRLMDVLQGLPQPWPDPGAVVDALGHEPGRLAVVRKVQAHKQPDHVFFVASDRGRGEPGGVVFWLVDVQTAQIGTVSGDELRTVLTPASAVALFDSRVRALSLWDRSRPAPPAVAALLDPPERPHGALRARGR